MSEKQTASGIEGIEVEAERILKEARERASEILLKANEEADRISSSGLALEEARAVCTGIVEEAKEEADRKIEEARVQASEIRARVDSKMRGIVSRLVHEITGV
jgi:vacuolar-type H+-ATPase subunit H